jgi:hypothetical protein
VREHVLGLRVADDRRPRARPRDGMPKLNIVAAADDDGEEGGARARLACAMTASRIIP